MLIAAAALFRQAIPELGIGRVVSAEFRHAWMIQSESKGLKSRFEAEIPAEAVTTNLLIQVVYTTRMIDVIQTKSRH